jgi:hypothetical protein
MNLTIKNYEKLKGKGWDDKNYIESITDRGDCYQISVWRDYMRQYIILNRDPVENGYYTIGKWSNEAHCVRYPYWIKHEDIVNIDSLMDKLKFMTDDWQPKLI